MYYHKSISPPPNVDMSDQYQTPGREWRHGWMTDGRKRSSNIKLCTKRMLCYHTMSTQRLPDLKDKCRQTIFGSIQSLIYPYCGVNGAPRTQSLITIICSETHLFTDTLLVFTHAIESGLACYHYPGSVD